jgi:hypothetical protein
LGQVPPSLPVGVKGVDGGVDLLCQPVQKVEAPVVLLLDKYPCNRPTLDSRDSITRKTCFPLHNRLSLSTGFWSSFRTNLSYLILRFTLWIKKHLFPFEGQRGQKQLQVSYSYSGCIKLRFKHGSSIHFFYNVFHGSSLNIIFLFCQVKDNTGKQFFMPLILNLDTVILLVRCHIQEFLRVLYTSEGVCLKQ